MFNLAGERTKSFKPHQASVSDIEMDSTADFVATASIDGEKLVVVGLNLLIGQLPGQVVVHSLSTTESYVFDMKRPIRTVALEPHFAKRASRAFVCGGMAGTLVLREKGWLGHKETILHSAEGPIWNVRWREHFIAWANDFVSSLVVLRCHHSNYVCWYIRESRYTTLSPSLASPLSTDHLIALEPTFSSVLSIGRTTPRCSLLGPTTSRLHEYARVLQVALNSHPGWSRSQRHLNWTV